MYVLDIIDIMQYTAIAVICSVVYVLIVNHKKFRVDNGHYTVPGRVIILFYIFKLIEFLEKTLFIEQPAC